MAAVMFGGAYTTSPEGSLDPATDMILYGDWKGYQKLVDCHEETYGKLPGV